MKRNDDIYIQIGSDPINFNYFRIVWWTYSRIHIEIQWRFKWWNSNFKMRYLAFYSDRKPKLSIGKRVVSQTVYKEEAHWKTIDLG